MPRKFTGKPKAILLSKRANIFYIEHARILQKDERVLYLTDSGERIEQFFNIPERNTALLMLGQGTSITQQAARKLAESGVMVGFCGTGGSPLYSATEPAFLVPQSEYRPTEYMQAWMKLWLDDASRLTAAKAFFDARIRNVLSEWGKNPTLLRRGISVHDSTVARFRTAMAEAADTQELLLAEADWAKALYATLARGFSVSFVREHGVGELAPTGVPAADRINRMLDHGNYIAYGLGAVALTGLGISFALPLLHGKTRRGALVFDVADLVKDAIVMPWAFEAGAANIREDEYRTMLIDSLQKANVLDTMFDTIKKASGIKPS